MQYCERMIMKMRFKSLPLLTACVLSALLNAEGRVTRQTAVDTVVGMHRELPLGLLVQKAQAMDPAFADPLLESVLLFVPAKATELRGPETSLIQELRVGVARDDEARWVTARRQLSGLGERAIPAIRAALSDSQGIVRLELLAAVGGMDGDAATSYLLELATTDPDERVRNGALAYLSVPRTIQRPVTAEEKAALFAMVSEDSLMAGSAALVVAICVSIPAEERARVVASRFVRETMTPPLPADILYPGITVSGDVFRLLRFVVALEKIGSPSEALAVLEEESSRITADEDAGRWLLIAQGFLESRAAATPLLNLVETETDVSLKAVALRAYARSAKHDAIPVLERYREEREAYLPPRHLGLGSRDPLYNAAAGELARLKRKE
jgi:hypothetical protein